MKKQEFHPVAEIFPMMPDAELEKLAADIREHDLREPIVTFEGKILDGRNRSRACEIADVEPRFEEFTGDDALAYVIGRNVRRRHLTESQRAMIAARLANMRQGERTDLEPSANSRKVSTTDAAELLNVGPRIVEDAKAVIRDDPEKAGAVERGEMTVHQAKREIRREKVAGKPKHGEERPTVEPDGVFDVIVVDPPWPGDDAESGPRSGGAGSDRSPMSIAGIKALTLPMAENCHVWVWAPHRCLPAAFEVLRSWGVKYVSAFVWHKSNGSKATGVLEHNCDFVLYGRRGSPTFDKCSDFRVCFSAPETEGGEKPDEFYEMVCRATSGRRLEMFLGREIVGFESWGQEAPAGDRAA